MGILLAPRAVHPTPSHLRLSLTDCLNLLSLLIRRWLLLALVLCLPAKAQASLAEPTLAWPGSEAMSLVAAEEPRKSALSLVTSTLPGTGASLSSGPQASFLQSQNDNFSPSLWSFVLGLRAQQGNQPLSLAQSQISILGVAQLQNTVDPSVVPLPGAAWLFLSGLALGATALRKRGSKPAAAAGAALEAAGEASLPGQRSAGAAIS